MKTSRTLPALLLLLALALPLTVQAGSKLIKTTRMDTPPAGKVLVNFHRPSGYGGNFKVPIFDGTGTMLMDLPGKSEYQLVCEPGEHIFISWSEDSCSVIKGDLAADKTYDIIADISIGWVRPNIWIVPLNKDSSRRDKIAEFEKRETRIYTLERNKYVTDYEAKNQKRVE